MNEYRLQKSKKIKFKSLFEQSIMNTAGENCQSSKDENRNTASPTTFEITLELADSETNCEEVEFTIDNEVIILSESESESDPTEAEAEVSNVIASKKLKLLDLLSFPNAKSIVPLQNWFDLRWCCFLCSYFSCNYFELREHYESYHQIINMEDIFYQCPDCDTVVQCYATFVNHIRFLHHPELQTSCDVCSIRFSISQDLSTHRDSYHHVKPSSRPEIFYCDQCERAYANKTELISHQKMHTFICEICQDQFTSAKNLDRHKANCHNSECHSCAICNQSFKTLLDLEEHLHQHFNTGQIKCRFCDETFSTCLRRQLHERSHVVSNYFQCTECFEKFPMGCSLELFQKHLLSHNEKFPYKCEKCPKKFKESVELKVHLLRHSIQATNTLTEIYRTPSE